MNRLLAAQLARLAELAYAPLDTVRSALPCADVELVDVDDTQVYLIAGNDRAVAAFRGTQITAAWSWADIRSNLLRGKKPWLGYNGQYVHGGYYEAFMDVLLPVRAFAEHHRLAGRRVFHTGHSLGGVLATLAAAAIPATATYTFGAPRAGNRAFARSLEGRNLYRIVHARDIAPNYPSIVLGYRHGGRRWHLHRDGRLNEGGVWRDVLAASLFEGLVPEGVRDLLPNPVTGLTDHAVGNYVRLLAKGTQT